MVRGQPAIADLAPGRNPHTVRQTAAAAFTLPKAMIAARLVIKGHATEPTTLAIRYNGVARAMFHCEPGGWRTYDFNLPVGTSLPATWLTVAGLSTPQAWNIIFDEVGYGPDISTFRGILFEAAVAASGTPVTVNFDETDATGQRPLAALGSQTSGVAAANARWAFPAVGAIQNTVEVPDDAFPSMVPQQAPSDLGPATSLTMTPTIVGAATTTSLVVYY